jgi:small GTP-binding protein
MQNIENTGANKDGLLDLSARQITYDREQLRTEFLDHVSELFSKLQTEEITNLLGPEFSQKIRTAKKQLEDRLRGDFRVVVMGDFKRGKSTLVNALLETPLAPTNITPETVTINEIAYGEKLEAQICLADHGRIRLKPGEIASEMLIPIMEDLTEKDKNVSHLEIKAPIEWLKNANLVDTPGLGDVLAQFDGQVQNYLNQADAVVYLISAISPLSETETNFLRLSIAPQDFPKIIFVVNMLDLAQSNENVEKVLSHVTEKVTRLFPHAQIYGLSAFDEVCRLNHEPRPNSELAPILEMNFREFRSTLQNSILLDRNLIQLDRAGDLLRLTTADFEHSIALLSAVLNQKQTELARSLAELTGANSEIVSRIAGYKQDFRDQITRLGEQSVGWINEFLDRIEREVIVELSNFEYEEIQRHFHFFLSDRLRESIAQCYNMHRELFLKAAETASKSIHKETQITLPVLSDNESLALNTTNPEWTSIDTIGAVVSFLTPVGFFVELGSKALFKSSDNLQRLHNYRRQLEKTFPDLRERVALKLRESYQEIAEKFEKLIETAYEEEKNAILAALERARQLQGITQPQAEETLKRLAKLRQLLTESRIFVESLNEKLWVSTRLLQAEGNYPSASNFQPKENDLLDNRDSQPVLV